MLTFVEVATPYVRSHGREWVVQCDCGTRKVMPARKVKSGRLGSCGCYRYPREGNKHAEIHGHASGRKSSPTHKSWHAMKSRCSNPNDPSYERYGGRGIKVCSRWEVFENFLADMGERQDGLTLDRIENDRDYQPGNCRWATPAEQARNRSNNTLTLDVVREIRRRYAAGQRVKELAIEFNMARPHMTEICTHRQWKDPAGPPPARFGYGQRPGIKAPT